MFAVGGSAGEHADRFQRELGVIGFQQLGEDLDGESFGKGEGVEGAAGGGESVHLREEAQGVGAKGRWAIGVQDAGQ